MKHFNILFRAWRYFLPLLLFIVAGSVVAQTPTPVDSCQYKLVMQSRSNVGWNGRSLNFIVNPNLFGLPGLESNVGHFTMTSYNPVTTYLFLPKGWMNIDCHELKDWWVGDTYSFSLYDEEDSLIFFWNGNMQDNYLWYNGCSLDIPDTVTAFTHSVQGNVVSLAWTNPTTAVRGDVLSTISSVEIRRNDELIQTFTGTGPGSALTFSDNVPDDGTYIYTVQCFNEAGGGVPAITHLVAGNNWTLHNGSHSGQYTNTTCSVSISNDNYYTLGGTTTLTIHQSDTTKMLKISGHSLLNSNANIQVYAGTPENGVLLSSDTVMTISSYHTTTFVLDIPAGSFQEFHYTVECVNSLYEQPDTTVAIVPDTDGIIYVTQEGAGSRNGSSWTNATPWLNRALAAADTMTLKPVIWVAKGTYYGTPQQYDNDIYEYDNDIYAFVGRDNVNVFGGFAGNEPANYDLSLRDFEQNETVLDGLMHHTVVLLNNCEWNGFHITRGTNGCYLAGNPILRKCLVNHSHYHGVTGSEYTLPWPLIDSCTIVDNDGNGISMRYFTLINSRIARNGGDGVSSIRALLHNCFVTQNGGNGVYFYYSDALVSNSLIANNDKAGVRFYDAGIIQNSTIVNNRENGVTLRFNSIFKNSIISGNGGLSICTLDGWNNFHEITNCAIEGDFDFSSDNNIQLSPSNNPFGVQPGFVNPTAGLGKGFGEGDWHLKPNSVCINRGKTNINVVNTFFRLVVPTYILTVVENFPIVDLEGNARIRQNIPDIGAFESDYPLADVNLFIHPDSNHIIYVTEDGSGDGASWQNATSELTKAIEMAWLYGPETQIWVAQGTYPTNNTPFYIKENLRMLGGFVGDEAANYPIDLRNTLAHPSVLNGQNQNRVLHQTRDFESMALVDGFTLIRGYADQGAGACLMAGTTLSKCRIINNTVTSVGSAVVTATRDTLKQLIVENNEGTGILAENSHLLHCTVVKNDGDGIRMSGNTIQDTSLLCNNIAWGNALLNLRFTSAMAQNNTPVQHCAIENQIVNGTDNITLSSNNTDASGPHFISPTDSLGSVTNMGNWLLDSLSVCVNGGAELSDAYGMITDIDGNPRVQNDRADIGAYETPLQNQVLCRNMEALIYEGESYTFYDTTLATAGWYARRWNVGNADSLVILHLITKQVVYVSVNGAGLKDGSSWSNALDGETASDSGRTKLADALANASINTDFWLQSGVYHACSDSDVTKSLILNEGVALHGGFAGMESSLAERDSLNSPTLFSGNLQQDTVREHYSSNIFKTNEQNTLNHPIVLDRISIAEGYNEIHSGCALHITGTSEIQAEHCRFHHNYGSAIYNEGLFTANYCLMDSNISFSSYWTSNNLFYEGHLHYEGAGAFTNRRSGTAIFKNCYIKRNSAPYDGAIFNDGIMEIDSSDISYNTATEGTIGAIFNTGSLVLQDCFLSHNYSYAEFSTIASWGSLKMNYCTIEYNQSNLRNPLYYWPTETWAAIYNSAHVMSSGENTEVTHCLFKRNTQNAGSGGGCLHIDGSATIRHCDFVENIGSLGSGSDYVMWGDGEDDEPSGGLVIGIAFETIYSDGGGVHVCGNGEVCVEDCLFDGHIGMNGSAASVRSGKLTMNRCRFTRNISNVSDYGGVLSVLGGELHVWNSLFANNQNMIFNTEKTVNSKTTFTNCTFANNGSNLCFFAHPNTPYDCDAPWVNLDTAHVNFENCVITGNWNVDTEIECCNNVCFYPNYTLTFANTLFDTLHTETPAPAKAKTQPSRPQLVVNVDEGGQNVFSVSELQADATLREMLVHGNVSVNLDSEGNRVYRQLTVSQDADNKVLGLASSAPKNAPGCTPDSLGNIYYCDPMFVNPTTVLGVDSVQNPLLYDFRLQDGSPCINSGDTTGLHLTADATDLAGERRVKQCRIDRGCYEYGTVVYDTVFDELCVEADSLPSLVYTGHGFTIEHPEPGLHFYSGSGTCDPSGTDTIGTIGLMVKLASHTTENHTACDSYEWNGETYTESGDYTVTFTNAAGCDSVVTLHLTVNNSDATDFSVTVYDSYDWNGVTYTESGDYEQTFTNVNGCDSVVTLHLTICTGITTLPYSEDFEDFTESTTAATDVEPTCWELVRTDATSMPDDKRPQIYYNANFAHSGDYSLLMNYRCIYAMPVLSEETTLQNVKLDMYLRQSNAAYQLEVGVWDDATNTFTRVALFNNTTTGVEHVTCDFSGYSGYGRRIAFRNTLSNGKAWSYSYNYIDDIILTEMVDCSIPLPYSEDFEDFTESTTAATGVEPTCWELVRTDATSMPDDKRPQVYYRSDFAHSGDYSLLMNYRCVYAMPEISEETDIPLNRVKLDMYLRQSNAAYQLEVGVWDDAMNTFEPVALFNNATTGVEHVTCDFSGYTGNGRRIAFRNTLSNGKTWSYSYNYIDDIILTEMVNCSITLPYSENFEDFTESTTAATGVEPDCWELVYEDATITDATRPQIYYNGSFAHSGGYTLKMSNRCVYAMPEISEETDIPLNRVKLEMYLRQPNTAYQLEVGVWNDATNTFTPVALFNNVTTGVEHVTCDFSSFTGNGRRIAFRNTLGNGKTWSYSYNYIDDITLTEMVDCSITLPYSENFEDFTESTTTATGVEPDCWELVYEDATITDATRPQIYYNGNFAHSGDYTLKMGNRCVYAMPELEPNVPMNKIGLDMYLRQPNAAYQLEVGVWNGQEFVPVATFNNSTTAVEHVTCNFSGYNGNGRRIAFRNTLGGGKTWSYSYNYIDDIYLTRITNNKNAEVSDANTMDANTLGADRNMVDIVIYPNPTRDYINVECTMNDVQCSGIEVVDVYGKVVRTVVGANNDSPTQINVSGLAAGMYFVRVTTEDGFVTKAFVKR